jgi:hypothetical protein
MESTINLLAGILEKQIANYEALKTLALEKRAALAANDLKLLSKVTADIQSVAASNYRLEEERSLLASSLAAELGLAGQNCTLAEIADHLDGSSGERLRALRKQARAAIHDAQRQNHINAEMLKYCANLMDSVLRSLVEPKPDQQTYGCTGAMRRGTASAVLLDHHI